MPDLTEEEKKILRQAYEIKERIKAEELEAGEVSVDEAVDEELSTDQPIQRPRKQTRPKPNTANETSPVDERSIYGPEASNEAIKKAPENEKKMPVPETEKKKRPKQTKQKVRETVKKAEKKPRKEKKKKGFLHKLLKVLIIILIIMAVALAGVYAFLRTTIAQTNYKPYETSYERQDDVLIGTDTRVAGSNDARSDAMIVVSINPYKRKLVMTSIMRDSYVTIPGYGENRINEAYSRGGAALLIQTIEENYKLGIDYYAQVDFFSFVDVIDAFGGVTINVEQAEVEWINGYIAEYNQVSGVADRDGFVDEQFAGGQITLTGKQALGYARIRKIGNDFARTQRQRTVMNALLENVKKANVVTIYKAVESILPDISTNISDSKMCSLLMQSVLYLNYDMVQARVPADGTWSNAIMGANQEVLAVDFGANKSYLQSTIYE